MPPSFPTRRSSDLQDLHATELRCAQQRPQLDTEQFRLFQTQADCAQAERRIVRSRSSIATGVDLLVRAKIERADRDGARHRRDDARIGLELLVLARQILAIHVEEFGAVERSEEHTSELQSLMRISYAVYCLKTNK